MSDTPESPPTTSRRALLKFAGAALLGAAGAVAAISFDDTRKIFGMGGRDKVNNALETFTSRNGPVKVSQQRLLSTSAVAYVDADLRQGDKAPSYGCEVLDNLPADWDAVAPESEVYLTLSATRDDVVLVGFEVTEVTRRPLGKRTIVGCEAGGNGAPSGFNVSDTKEGVRIEPVGPGSQRGNMRLFLAPGEDYNLAAWFSTTTQQVTTWSGEFIFSFGNNGDQEYRLPVGPAHSAGRPRNAPTFTVEGGRWR
jgi:hypothetical protein